MDDTDNQGFLEADNPIPGQNYVCLSFLSPEAIIQNREVFFVKHFLNDLLNDKKRLSSLSEKTDPLTYDNVVDMFETFKINNEEKVMEEFEKTNDFKTSMRGIKVRGVYDTLKEAQVKAKLLQKKDPLFHVFVGQVGYWLPWDPEPYKIANNEYCDEQLNEMMKRYKDNKNYKDMLFEEDKRNRINEAKKNSNQNKTSDEVSKDQEKIKEIHEIVDEKQSIFREKQESNDQGSSNNDLLGVNSQFSDPWMARKMAQDKENNVKEV